MKSLWAVVLACTVAARVDADSSAVPESTQTAVRQCLVAIIDDIAAVKNKYPELATFSADAMKQSLGPRPDFAEWELKFRYERGYVVDSRPQIGWYYHFVGEHGCVLGVSFFPSTSIRPLVPTGGIQHLGLAYDVFCMLPPTASAGLQEAITTITSKHIAKLRRTKKP